MEASKSISHQSAKQRRQRFNHLGKHQVLSEIFFLLIEKSPHKDFQPNGKYFTSIAIILNIGRAPNSEIYSSIFGVSLFNPVDIYQQSMRIAKYALMLIVFTFMAFFLSEIMNRLRVHPVQYMLIGLAVIIFYTLLLAISEHASFGSAYLISTVAVVFLITAYAKSILKSARAALMVGGLLAILYLYLYILLQIEEYALLMGSVGLFVLLGIIMYITRMVDWYTIGIGTSTAIKARDQDKMLTK